jgi:glycosyltransferase involved in cell wall biosynthesis
MSRTRNQRRIFKSTPMTSIPQIQIGTSSSRPLTRLTPQTAEFVMLSFEGPDRYSLIGGLGVRATELSTTLAEMGFRVRFYFIGDPAFSHSESHIGGNLSYHRWAQWLSAHHPGGVYDGEESKIQDFSSSIPSHLVNDIIRPNAERDKVTIVLAEEWHTTGAVIQLSQLLIQQALHRHCLILWNANNTFGFHCIDWQALRSACAITTVSRYMKHLMADIGLNPLVIPNGIPQRWHEQVDSEEMQQLRRSLDHPGDAKTLMLAKVGRYHPDKRWLMAIEVVGQLKRAGYHPKILIRGSKDNHRIAILEKAFEQGLVWAEIRPIKPTLRHICQELKRNREADVLELDFFVPEEFMRVLYGAADAVLANSLHEPFGLVGLEVMACTGIAVTGSSGEDYANSFVNCVRIDSDDPREICVYLKDLMAHPETAQDIRGRARLTSSLYVWELVVQELFRKIEFVAQMRGVSIHH